MKSVKLICCGIYERSLGGWAAVAVDEDSGENLFELSGGFQNSNACRMVLAACKAGLERLDEPSRIALDTDNDYLINALAKKWAEMWRRHDWKLKTGGKAKNVDLFEPILDSSAKHEIECQRVNVLSLEPDWCRCRLLAAKARSAGNLPFDTGYEDQLYAKSAEASQRTQEYDEYALDRDLFGPPKPTRGAKGYGGAGVRTSRRANYVR